MAEWHQANIKNVNSHRLEVDDQKPDDRHGVKVYENISNNEIGRKDNNRIELTKNLAYISVSLISYL